MSKYTTVEKITVVSYALIAIAYAALFIGKIRSHTKSA